MKLFDDFEAVKFPEENLLFVTNNKYLYYIYDPKRGFWKKHRNAGNDRISVNNYQDISRKEIETAMGGVFPTKETDFMRHCNPSQLCIRDMFDLFKEDYPNIIENWAINNTVHYFLLESDICYRSYLALRALFGNALDNQWDNEQTLGKIKELSFRIIGRDIFKPEIGIVDGHDPSSYFWIRPVRIIDHDDPNGIDTVAEMSNSEISIEEDDVAQYLTPFLYKYFDNELEANKNRYDQKWIDDNGEEQASYITEFEWYLTHNFYTFDATRNILNDIRDTIDALSSGRETKYTIELKKKRGIDTFQLLYAKGLSEEEIKEYNDNRPTEDDTEIELIIDFYRRLVYRLEYMIKVGKEKGYDLISFMGP